MEPAQDLRLVVALEDRDQPAGLPGLRAERGETPDEPQRIGISFAREDTIGVTQITMFDPTEVS
jgi:hypothetical protein